MPGKRPPGLPDRCGVKPDIPISPGGHPPRVERGRWLLAGALDKPLPTDRFGGHRNRAAHEVRQRSRCPCTPKKAPAGRRSAAVKSCHGTAREHPAIMPQAQGRQYGMTVQVRSGARFDVVQGQPRHSSAGCIFRHPAFLGWFPDELTNESTTYLVTSSVRETPIFFHLTPKSGPRPMG